MNQDNFCSAKRLLRGEFFLFKYFNKLQKKKKIRQEKNKLFIFKR